MAAKTQAAESSPRGGRPTQRHEIVGILSMAFALFALLSLLSMQLGTNEMMGPGGAATAAGLYTLAGLSAYLVIAGLTVAAIRCFRARPLIAGPGEAAAVVLLLGAVAILLHLPFAGRAATFHGPGGLLGQYLGEVVASFIGVVGAALAGATMLFVSLLLLSAIRLHEVIAVLGWAGRQTGHALWAGLCAVGRVARAAFPEKGDRDDEEADEDGDADAQAYADGERAPDAAGRTIEIREEDIRSVIDAAEGDAFERAREIDDELDAVRVGEARTVAEKRKPARAAFAEVVAEMAAVERLA